MCVLVCHCYITLHVRVSVMDKVVLVTVFQLCIVDSWWSQLGKSLGIKQVGGDDTLRLLLTAAGSSLRKLFL